MLLRAAAEEPLPHGASLAGARVPAQPSHGIAACDGKSLSGGSLCVILVAVLGAPGPGRASVGELEAVECSSGRLRTREGLAGCRKERGRGKGEMFKKPVGVTAQIWLEFSLLTHDAVCILLTL